jgi:purine-binding chemotaxis protein CheW
VPRTEYLAFHLAGESYAAPVGLIREILKPPPLTPVPRAPHAVMGIISVRGQIVTVLDLRRRLHLPESPPTPRTRILLVEAENGETLGLYVDEVLQVHRLAETEIERAAMALGGDVAEHIAGIARPQQVQQAAIGKDGAPRKEGITKEERQAAPVIILLDIRAVLGN